MGLRLDSTVKLSHPATALLLVLAVAGGVWGLVKIQSIEQVQPASIAGNGTVSTATEPVTGYRLDISQIDVTVPVNLDVPGTNEKEYFKALETGIAHYAGTPKPGEKGNAFLFGHSSYLEKSPGDYKEVFKRLNEIAVDDRFEIKHETETLTYKVYRSEVIKETDFSVLDQPTDPNQEVVTIMTCWPPGTTAKRWVLQAERVVDIPITVPPIDPAATSAS